MTGQIVITGAAGGIGAAMCDHFLLLGRVVAGIDIRPIPTPRATAAGFVGQSADITDETAIERAFDRIAQRGQIAAVIANAAVTDLDHHETVAMPYATWEKVLRVNVDGAFLTGRAAARRMTNGNIIFITSSLALLTQAKARDGPYCTSKAAVEMLARVMAKELAEKGVNVNTLYPSAIIDTGFFAHWPDEQHKTLSPPSLLNATAAYLVDLAPGAATGRSLDQDRWDKDDAYRAEWGAS